MNPNKWLTIPVRRRIVMFLMLLGNAGFVAVLSSLVLTFMGEGSSGSLVYKLLLLGAGLFLLTLLEMSSWVDRHLSNLIDSALKRYATLGAVGFDGRQSYAAIGTVSNLAARLCDEAQHGQILISRRMLHMVEHCVQTDPLGEFSLKGFQQNVSVYNVLGLREQRNSGEI